MANGDDKYGRLYPERAVEKARAILQEIIDSGVVGWSTRAAPEVTHNVAGALDDLDRLGFPPDEPLFLLRGQDVLAPGTVRFYGYEWGRRLDRLDAQDVARHIDDHADAMERWQPRKLPD